MQRYEKLFHDNRNIKFIELRTYRICEHDVPYNPELFTEVDGQIYCTAKNATIIEQDDMPLMNYIDRNMKIHTVISAIDMFNGCDKLTILNCRNWNVECISNFTRTFANCSSLVYLDMSQWKTYSIIETDSMFENCVKLMTANVGNWNTNNLVSANSMFRNCYNLRNVGEISNWNVHKLLDIRYMFQNTHNFVNITDKVKWNVSYNSPIMIDDSFSYNWPDWALNLCIYRHVHNPQFVLRRFVLSHSQK